MPHRPQPLRVAIDTGGTFTDCVWRDATHRLHMLKVFSTPADPSQAIVEALRKIDHKGELVILHGTTVGTNTLLERKGARTALVTTAGFEDAIEIGRQARPKLYDFFFDRIEPLVPADLRFGIEERTTSDGEILTTPSPSNLQELAAQVTTKHIESIAISLFFSFANPKNEQAIAEALKLLGIPLSISNQILPEFREYERTSTVVINAYLQPIMQLYLENLKQRFSAGIEQRARVERRFSAASKRSKSLRALAPEVSESPRIFVMQSNGGITALASAAAEPVRTVLSGPAGGVVGAAASARASGFPRIIAFDMGGTSTDVSLVDNSITTASHAEIAGLPIGVPMLDIHTVGAGGGSLARFDAAGVLRVGPESAGADPGPICYGRGTQPTVTDANLLLGRLQPTRFLGGDFTLDLDRTRRVTREWLKQQGNPLTLERFAAGVVRVVNATMEKAIRVVSIERGRDPRDYVLVAFGGAGGLHACALAEALSIPHVIIPALPGALSALGILVSDVVKDYSRTILLRVSGKLPIRETRPGILSAAETSRERFSKRSLARKSTPSSRRGRPLPRPRIRTKPAVHERSANRFPPGTPPPLRLRPPHTRRRASNPPPPRNTEIPSNACRKDDHVGTAAPGRPGRVKLGLPSMPKAPVLFDGKKLATSILSRDDLKRGKTYNGPAIITEYSATTVIPPGRRFHLDRSTNLIID